MTEQTSVLIAEDGAVQAALLRKLLESAGYKVQVARNGLEALALLDQSLPDVVISDIDMPEMDGYQLCRAIKSEPRSQHIPVILLTNLSDPHNVIQGLQAGADNYVTKPFDGPKLLARVESLRLSPSLYKEPKQANPLEVHLAGRKFSIEAGREQILNLLLSTFEGAVWQNQQLRKANDELQLMHREMEDKNRALAAAIELQNRFLGMAAHDMRNPLTVTLGYSKILLEGMGGQLAPPQQKFVASIHRSAENLLRLVNELLDLSEIESGNLQLHMAQTDLHQLVTQVVELNSFLAENKLIKITSDLQSVPSLLLDAGKVEQVLNNLLTNAVKFSHPNTTVRVVLKVENEGITLSVIDQGLGIPKAEQAALFDPFQKTSVRGTAGEKSTGLGLAIVKRILEGHGATIDVDSEPGRGSEFRIRFPLRQDSLKEAR